MVVQFEILVGILFQAEQCNVHNVASQYLQWCAQNLAYAIGVLRQLNRTGWVSVRGTPAVERI